MLQPSQDFLSKRGEKNQPEKSEWSKRQLQNAQKAEHEELKQKAKALTPDTTRRHSSSNKQVKKASEKTSKEELAKYPQYYALTEYERSCLSAINYWRVIGGLSIIEVPPSDTDYAKYFDARCYQIAEENKRKPVIKKEQPEIVNNYELVKESEKTKESPAAIQKEEAVVKSKETVVEQEEAKETNKVIWNKREGKTKDMEINARIPDDSVKKTAAKKKKKPDDNNNQPSLF